MEETIAITDIMATKTIAITDEQVPTYTADSTTVTADSTTITSDKI